MEYTTLLDGTKIPSIGLGTWRFGGGTEPDYSKDAEEVASVRRAIEMGYTLVDTAEMYGGGHCEELIGKAIKGMPRDKVFIVTKVTSSNLRHKDVHASCEKSLKRLDVDFIDLYLIHAPNPEVPLAETFKALDELVASGKVKRIGVSNFTVELLIEAQKCTKNKIMANQIEYSLLARDKGTYGGNHDMESKTVPYCQKHGIIVMAERPVERGLFTKVEHPLLAELSAKYGKTPAQIAIRWLIGQKNVVAIPKAASEVHQRENLGAYGWEMSAEDREKLNSIKFDVEHKSSSIRP